MRYTDYNEDDFDFDQICREYAGGKATLALIYLNAASMSEPELAQAPITKAHMRIIIDAKGRSWSLEVFEVADLAVAAADRGEHSLQIGVRRNDPVALVSYRIIREKA